MRLTLTDVQGRLVSVLAAGVRAAGRYTAALEARDLYAGIFFVRMQAGATTVTRRFVVVN